MKRSYWMAAGIGLAIVPAFVWLRYLGGTTQVVAAIQWLNDNQGAIIALLTVVLVVSTFWYALKTHQLATIAKRQLDKEHTPNVLLTWTTQSRLWLGIDNHGKYSITIRSILLVVEDRPMPVTLQVAYSPGSLAVSSGSSKQLTFSTTPFGVEHGTGHIFLVFQYGGTGDAIHTLDLEFDVSAFLQRRTTTFSSSNSREYHDATKHHPESEVQYLPERTF